MRQIVWHHPLLTIEQLVEISDLILNAEVHYLSTVPGERKSLINFSDEATDEELARALAIAESYDAATVEAVKKDKKKERTNDLRPFKNVQALIDENTRDRAALKDAKLADMKDLLDALYDREVKVLKALSRLLEGQIIDEGDGQ